MKQETKEKIKQGILKRYELYKIHSNRLRRLIKDPLRTLLFYILVLLSQIYPFKVKYKTLWGDKMSFYLPDGNAILYYDCSGEADLTNFFINSLKEGDVFIDIGAHLGFYSLLAARLVGEGKVYSFEPTPRTFGLLKENVSPVSNVILNQRAVLDKEGVIPFVDYGLNYGAYNTYKDRTSEDIKRFLRHYKKMINVKTIVLDKYCQENNVKPTFIKIDAEGAEHLILKGMSYILKSLRPVISIEATGGKEWKENCRESIKILMDNDYKAFNITPEGKLIAHNIKEEYGYENLIFVPYEKD